LGSNTKGDLYVKILIQVPGSLNAAQKKLVEELAGNGL
jgi:DnaJ-class molecular chaperone